MRSPSASSSSARWTRVRSPPPFPGQIEETDVESDQVVEIHRPAIAKPLLIGGVHAREPAIHHRERRLLEFLRRDAVVLETRDARARAGRGEALVLRSGALEKVAQNGALIVGVVDHEILGIAQELGVPAKDAHAGAVEGPQPD